MSCLCPHFPHNGLHHFGGIPFDELVRDRPYLIGLGMRSSTVASDILRTRTALSTHLIHP
jgi:hypothetical protein